MLLGLGAFCVGGGGGGGGWGAYSRCVTSTGSVVGWLVGSWNGAG